MLEKYLEVPYKMLPSPLPNNILTNSSGLPPDRSLSNLDFPSLYLGVRRSPARYSWLKRSTPIPRARKPRPVRIQDKKVRSEARWSRAVLPVLWRTEPLMREKNGIMDKWAEQIKDRVLWSWTWQWYWNVLVRRKIKSGSQSKYGQVAAVRLVITWKGVLDGQGSCPQQNSKLTAIVYIVGRELKFSVATVTWMERS